MTYTKINIEPIPVPLDIALSDEHEAVLNAEYALAYAAPALLTALRDCIDALAILDPAAWSLTQARAAYAEATGVAA